jgi:alkylation response protein AidB-like acyl-CoA dehydrogenase
MDFDLDETCEAVVQTADAVMDDSTMDPEAMWKELGRSGLLSLSVPARLGGEGLGLLPTMTVLTEVGRRGLALPAMATLALGVLPLVRWATPSQQDELLADGPVLTAALREPSDPQPSRPGTTCTGDLALTGTKVGVTYAQHARSMLVPVSLTTGGTAVALIPPAAPGVSMVRTPASSETPEWTVTFDRAVATGLLPGDAVADLYQLAVAGACAIGDGAVAGALALTSGYIGSREQFGKPIATFQAAAAQIADLYIVSRTLHLATLSACWRLSEGRAAQSDVDIAGYWFAEHAPAALRTCHHLHGGIGLDVSYPLHRYSSLVKDLVRAMGGSEHRLTALGHHVH